MKPNLLQRSIHCLYSVYTYIYYVYYIYSICGPPPLEEVDGYRSCRVLVQKVIRAKIKGYQGSRAGLALYMPCSRAACLTSSFVSWVISGGRAAIRLPATWSLFKDLNCATLAGMVVMRLPAKVSSCRGTSSLFLIEVVRGNRQPDPVKICKRTRAY